MLKKLKKILSKSSGIQINIDVVNERYITGWAWNRANPENRLVVACDLEGGDRRETLANKYRVDLKQAGIGDGRYAFELDLDGKRPLLSKNGNILIQILNTSKSLEISADAHFSPNVELKYEPFDSLTFSGGGSIMGLNGSQLSIVVSQPWLQSPPVLLINGCSIGGVFNSAGVSGEAPLEMDAGVQSISGFPANASVELFGFTKETFKRLDQYILPTPVIEVGFLAQLYRASLIARQPGAVAITCWDGAHNPIGRAKVLYDVVSGKRPAVIISYLFTEFGGSVWPPILNESCAILTIPWERRHIYEAAIRSAGLRFDTVWVCKPRLPSFRLGVLVADPEARVILDLDDNEEEFSLSPAAHTKFYGKLTINLVRQLIEEVPARTVASISLYEAFGGHVLRHARAPFDGAFERVSLVPAVPVKVGFIGTVRPHKRILEAAKAISRYSQSRGQPVEFHVYGDVNPRELVVDLEKLGVVVKLNIPMRLLNTELAAFDVVLTGFPSVEDSAKNINRFQISSKIGDALAVRRPVLVPESPSTRDLASINGVFLFDVDNFEQRLQDAINFVGQVCMPDPFTLKGAYSGFCKAEIEAEKYPSVSGLRALLPEDFPSDFVKTPLRKSLLLVWKQHDAGLYGRRVDQIARHYKRESPDHDVVVLELLHSSEQKKYESGASEYNGDLNHISALSDLKRLELIDGDGVQFIQLMWNTPDHLQRTIEEFLLKYALLPQNTVVVLFPILREIDRILSVLKAYRSIVDIVDNQVSWSNPSRKSVNIREYFMLSHIGDAIVFNSAANRDYFKKMGFLPEHIPVYVIPNWYQVPNGFKKIKGREGHAASHKQIVYSGNMRDRFDFDLLILLAERLPDVKIHLIGVLRADDGAALHALQLPNIVYHGPKPEHATLEFLGRMDLAIVPHRVDDVSTYMDPLKVEMYDAIDLPMVTTNVPGIESTELIAIATSNEDFIEKVAARLLVPRALRSGSHENSNAEAYGKIIMRLLEKAEKGED